MKALVTIFGLRRNVYIAECPDSREANRRSPARSIRSLILIFLLTTRQFDEMARRNLDKENRGN